LSDKRRFNLHLPGLFKVLAEHLYSTRRVAVRELLQNAHDSCVRRRIEAGEADYRACTDLAIDAPARRNRPGDSVRDTAQVGGVTSTVRQDVW
jgi:HSP90 family molecular chaperone